MKLNLSKQDMDVIYLFFSNRTYKSNSDYLKMNNSWKSTTEINFKLGEPWKRTKKRLEKLFGFGLLENMSIPYKNRMDEYWCLKRVSLYLILSTLPRDRMIQFLRTNKNKIREFDTIEKLAVRNDLQISYLLNQILRAVSNYQYYLLELLIERWFLARSNQHRPFFDIITTDFRLTLKENYKDVAFLKEMSKIFGKID